VQGGIRQELESLKVSLLIEAQGKAGLQRYRNKADLYEYRQVEKLAREASEKLGLRPDMVELDLSRLTDLLEDYRDSLKEKQQPQRQSSLPEAGMQQRCRAFLSEPGLLTRLNQLIGQAGVTGEETGRIMLFVIAASYKMPDTLHALIQGSSGSGKTHLLAKISSFIPQEDRKSFTRVTESLFADFI
jgi:DNA primase